MAIVVGDDARWSSVVEALSSPVCMCYMMGRHEASHITDVRLRDTAGQWMVLLPSVPNNEASCVQLHLGKVGGLSIEEGLRSSNWRCDS